jgi:hypothetical protein
MGNWMESCIHQFKVSFLETGLNIVDADEQAKWNIHPGVVLTDFADFQEPHLDMPKELRKNCYILHVPVQREGSVVSVFDPEKLIHRYIYLPFGTFLALRGDVWHSGFFGNPGNVRFHMVILRGTLPDPAILYCMEDPKDRELMVAGRDVAHDLFMEENDGKIMDEVFLAWHERQTLLLVEAWERVLANLNGGHKVSDLLSNLVVEGMKKRAADRGNAMKKTEGKEGKRKSRRVRG